MLGSLSGHGNAVNLHLGGDGAGAVSGRCAHGVHLGHGDAATNELTSDVRHAISGHGTLGGCGELSGGVTGNGEATELDANLGADEACEVLAGERLDNLLNACVDNGRFLNCHNCSFRSARKPRALSLTKDTVRGVSQPM